MKFCQTDSNREAFAYVDFRDKMRTFGTYFLEPPTLMLSTPMPMMTVESGCLQQVDHSQLACGATMQRCGHDKCVCVVVWLDQTPHGCFLCMGI